MTSTDPTIKQGNHTVVADDMTDIDTMISEAILGQEDPSEKIITEDAIDFQKLSVCFEEFRVRGDLDLFPAGSLAPWMAILE